eukprot:12056821-Karenia_brevis.AAC.1
MHDECDRIENPDVDHVLNPDIFCGNEAEDHGDDPDGEANASEPMMIARQTGLLTCSEAHEQCCDVFCHVEKSAEDLGNDPICEAERGMPMMISRHTGSLTSSEAGDGGCHGDVHACDGDDCWSQNGSSTKCWSH